ncbi:MAG TPA: membrane protein insertase YidC [Bacteroidales bacterium]|nr:membrane protein insertase YidC [Bacteroidales bacterium]HPS73816.1 membrane protein insertase YidC [Bacteroidales bacterium]
MTDRNTIIGLLLIFAVFIGFSYLMTPSKEESAALKRKSDSIVMVRQAQREAEIKAIAREQVMSLEKRKAEAMASGEVLDSTKIEKLALKDQLGKFSNSGYGKDHFVVLESDLVKMRIASKGGRIDRIELKKFKTWDGRPLVLMNSDSLHFNFSFFSANRLVSTENLFFQPVFYGNTPRGDTLVKITGNDSIVFGMRAYADASDTTISPDKYIELVYTLRGDDYMIGYRINFKGMTDVIDPSTKYLLLDWKENLLRQEKSAKMERMVSTIYYHYVGDEVDNLTETKDEEVNLKNEKVKWIGFKQQFFTTTLIAGDYFDAPRMATQTLPFKGNYLKTMTTELGIPFNPTQTRSINMSLYAGPNKFYTLKSYKLHLERQIPLGWSFRPMAWINIWAVIPVFTFFGNLGWNYGIIILILTIMLKIVLFPIAYKTYKSSAKMRVLKPDIDEINKKYPKPDEAMKKQQATMDLYKRAGVNPMAGCVPMLLQMPILIALFRFFPASIELRQQPFLWAADLSSYDSIWTFPNGFSLPFYGDHVSLFCLLMTISSIIYTKVNENMMGTSSQQMPGMKFMMYLMPAMFLFWFNDYSSGLSYYYLLANIFTFAQVFLIRATIDENKLHAQIEANKKKGVKKSGFQKRLEEMAKQQKYQGKRR